MRHLPWCMLRCNRIYLHRRNGGLSMFVYQYFSIIFFLFRCFIYFTLNQLYRNTPFKVNETWCTHTETHFFVKFEWNWKKIVFSMHASTIHFRGILTYFMTSAWKCMQKSLAPIPQMSMILNNIKFILHCHIIMVLKTIFQYLRSYLSHKSTISS